MSTGFLRRAALTIGALWLPLSMAHAGIVDYTTTFLGGDVWRYDYTITNAAPSIGFDELTLYFDVNSYGLLSGESAPAGWDPIVIQPDGGIPADGYFDVLSLSGLLGAGASVSGFSVSFLYLLPGVPGAQAFDLLDSSDFSVVYSGTTAVADPPSPVPEPGTLALLAIGLGAVIAARRAKPGT